MSEQEEEHSGSEDESEEQRLTEQEQELAMLRYSVGTAEENVKALVLVSTLATVVQLFLCFALIAGLPGVMLVLPYHLMCTLFHLFHWHSHGARDYALASLWSIAGCAVMALCVGGSARTVYEIGYMSAPQCVPTSDAVLFLDALMRAVASLIILLLCALIGRQYATLRRDYPRLQLAEAAVKETKSQ
jgi:hypothetical protein